MTHRSAIVLPPLLCLALGPWATPGASAREEPGALTGWAGVASLVSNPGPGETLFLIRATARWPEGGPKDRGRYAVRVRLPDGRLERRPLRPAEGPGSPTVTVQIPAAAVRNRLPGDVRIEATLVDAATGAPLGRPLVATIDQFPTTAPPGARTPSGPFSRGRPLDPGSEGAVALPNPGPDGWRFVRIVGADDRPGLFVATAEATNRQVAARLPDHDPNAGRSDEFLLDAPEQPAINLTPERAEAYLRALREADPAGVPYRLPTRAEWELAARAGADSGFWWGDERAFPGGANLLGPEPGEQADTTVPASPPSGPGYVPNPWGLRHTFGNVAEWASAGAEGFARMGGHFRSEAAEALEPVLVTDAGDLGPDPYVGLRPVFDLDEQAGAVLIRRLLTAEPGLDGVRVAFDPDRATATLSGTVPEPGDRRRAVDRLAPLWFLAAVVDEMSTPPAGPGRLARLGPPAGPPRAVGAPGRPMVEVPVSVRWDGPQPVVGSDWYVNVFGADGGHFAHRLGPSEPGRPSVRVAMPVGLLDADRSARVALSLGAPARSPDGPAIVSDVVRVPAGRSP